MHHRKFSSTCLQQETQKASLVAANLYAGENTLKESVIAWIDEPSQKLFFDALLKNPEWAASRQADLTVEEFNGL
jgi:hypothetical protein